MFKIIVFSAIGLTVSCVVLSLLLGEITKRYCLVKPEATICKMAATKP